MNRWELVQALFEETAELDPVERARLLRERLGERPELAREVEALVRADAEASGRLDRTALELLAPTDPGPDPDALAGQVVGSCRVEAHIASGGMGHVYRAVRETGGIERPVALKILRHGLEGEALQGRFRREQRALAALQHEHVVTFLDAGVLPDGRPFLVMELVEGQPLTRWCEERELGLRPRLELFRSVLAAVQHAHQRLIVHLDLKPSNCLLYTSPSPRDQRGSRMPSSA